MNFNVKILDRGKLWRRWIELMGSDFRDEVTRRDGIVGLTKLVDGNDSQKRK